MVHDLPEVAGLHVLPVLADPVEDDDGGVDGVAEDGQRRGDEVDVEGDAEDHVEAQHHQQIVDQRADRCHAGLELKAEGDVDQNQHDRRQGGREGRLGEVPAHRGRNALDLVALLHVDGILAHNGVPNGLNLLVAQLQGLDAQPVFAGGGDGGGRLADGVQIELGGPVGHALVHRHGKLELKGGAAHKVDVEVEQPGDAADGENQAHQTHGDQEQRNDPEELEMLRKAEASVLVDHVSASFLTRSRA